MERYAYDNTMKLVGLIWAYLEEDFAKSPPSSSLILQKRTPFTKGTAVSSSSVKYVWNLNFFFFIRNAIDPQTYAACSAPTETDNTNRGFNY